MPAPLDFAVEPPAAVDIVIPPPVAVDVVVTPTVVDVASGVGPPGPGVAAGGTAGQILTKVSSIDYQTQWADPSSGGGGVSQATGLWTPFTDWGEQLGVPENLMLTRIGDMVLLQGIVKRTGPNLTLPNGGYTPLGNIPDGFRPAGGTWPAGIAPAAFDGYAVSVCQVECAPDGLLVAYGMLQDHVFVQNAGQVTVTLQYRGA